ncbi:disintegrin and metalloproteinase domain-containing protein 26A-like [Sigmodon hispidus]
MLPQLCLWMLLLLSAFSPTGHARYSNPPEIVIPLRVTNPSKHDIYPDWLFYSLRFGGERHIITMKPTKSFISRNFLLLTYTDQGDLIEEQPFVQNDCYYHGDVDGDPESIVTINTCFGTLQGMLEIYGTSYEIMPKNLTSTFEHLVYKIDIKDTESFSMRCGLTEEEIARQNKFEESKGSTLMQLSYENLWKHHIYIEYFVVVDNAHYVSRNYNVTVCTQEIIEVVHGINVIYLQIDTEIILTALDVWNEKNHVDVDVPLNKLVPAFCKWKIQHRDKHVKNDISHLLVRKTYKHLGFAYQATICYNFDCAVNSFVTNSTQEMAFIASHEMGHILGMKHDSEYCNCGAKACIMASSQSNNPKFSNCSYQDFYAATQTSACLFNIPKGLSKVQNSTCGNNIVEEGEQCDCGSSESCARDPCCRNGCVLNPDADCAFGLCCKDCKFMPTGTVCRKMKDKCDFPEWCNGISGECPEDVYREDGSSCPGGGYCYNGTCHLRKEYCQMLFGNSAMDADKTCYTEMNKQGNRFGNCGNDSTRYKTCEEDDVLCGRFQCKNVKVIPQRRNHETVHWTHFKNISCWTIDYHFGMNLEDSAAVRDGMPCGPDSLCIGRKCVLNPVLLTNCSGKCNRQGVCNNKRHCHCNEQWKPPDCLIRGFGGSIDSGPPPVIYMRKEEPMKKSSLLSLLIIPLLLIFFFSILIAKELSQVKPKQDKSKPAPGNETKPAQSAKIPNSKVKK